MGSTKTLYSIQKSRIARIYCGLPIIFFIVSGLILKDGGQQALPVVLFVWAPMFLLAALIQSLEIVAVEFHDGIFILKSILRKQEFQAKDITSVSEKTRWLKGRKKAFIEVVTTKKKYNIPIAVDPSGDLLRQLKQL